MNDMTIYAESVGAGSYAAGASWISFPHNVSGLGLHYPGLVMGVSIFGAGSVTSMVTDGVTTPQNLTLIRADTDGSRRSEIWCLPNIDLTGMVGDEFAVTVTFSGTVDSVTGSCLYNYFGGIGFIDGATGTSTPLAELTMTPVKIDSILFSNFCINSAGGTGLVGQNGRWSVDDGGDNHGWGSDYGPTDTASYIMSYQTSGTANWVISGVELLDYQDSPPAVMGV